MTLAVDYIQALRVRTPMQRALKDLFRRFDAIAAPTRATVAYPATGKFQDAYPEARSGPPLIPAGNLCGLPAVCVPNGFGDHHLPTSLSLLGPAFAEHPLLALAAAYQSRTDWHTRMPPVS